jgi:RimJ/RimL family protein N-acetyltransferase
MAPTPSKAGLLDPGAMLSTTHELDDGSRARLRLTRPTDAALVRAFLEGLSEETRSRRFLAPTPEVTDATVRHFTFYNPRERMMLAATMLIDGRERIVGLADAAFLATGLAEIGVVVDDDAQGQGLGKLLSEAVASVALQRGASRLKAEMLHGNAPMLRLLERLGRTIRTVEDGRAVAYTRLERSRRSRRGRSAA